MSSADLSIYFVSAQQTRARQSQMKNGDFGVAVRAKIEEACANDQSFCLFNPAAWNQANPTARVPTEQSRELLEALTEKGFVASFSDGVYSIDWTRK